MPAKITLEHVALKAGVSLTTASLVLSGQGRISPETQERVLESAREVGYTQKKKRPEVSVPGSKDIAILIDMDPEWSNVLFLIRPIIHEFDRTVRQSGYNTVLLPISRADSTDVIMDRIRYSGAVGVATIHFGSPELLELLESAGIPAVVIMNSNYQDRFYTVCSDDFQGAYEGASCLIKNGHLRMGYVDCVRPDLPILPVDRFFGFKKAIEVYHLDFDDTMRCRIPLDDEGEALRSIDRLLRAHPDITAIFALDDDVALRVMEILRRMGMDVPGRISLLAPGDMLDYSLSYIPRITTMRIDTTYMGRIAAQMLQNRIAHNPEDLHVLKVKQQLVKRGSVKDIIRGEDIS